MIICGICRSVDKKQTSKWKNWPKKLSKCKIEIKPGVGATLNFRRKWQSKKILQCANLFGLPAYISTMMLLYGPIDRLFFRGAENGRTKRSCYGVSNYQAQTQRLERPVCATYK